MVLIGVDPGLAALGLATLELHAGGARVRALEVIRTQPSAKKRRLRAGDDLGDRVRFIAATLLARLQELPDLVAICVESKAIPFRGGRMLIKPSAVSALGRVRGLLDAFAVTRGLPVLEESAQELKRIATGRRDASKAEVAAALAGRFPEVWDLWPPQKTLREHAADALAAAVVGLESDLVRAAILAVAAANGSKAPA